MLMRTAGAVDSSLLQRQDFACGAMLSKQIISAVSLLSVLSIYAVLYSSPSKLLALLCLIISLPICQPFAMIWLFAAGCHAAGSQDVLFCV